jgi:hypothetical protein
VVIDPEFVGVEDRLLRMLVGLDGTPPLLRRDEVMGGENEGLSVRLRSGTPSGCSPLSELF